MHLSMMKPSGSTGKEEAMHAAEAGCCFRDVTKLVG